MCGIKFVESFRIGIDAPYFSKDLKKKLFKKSENFSGATFKKFPYINQYINQS
jgi:hypothetical protein